MEAHKRHLMLLALVSGYFAACSGGSLTGPKIDAGTDVAPISGSDGNGDAGSCSGSRGGAETPTTHRPTAIACSPSPIGPAVPDGGTQECATNADCANDAGSQFTTCLRGHCAFDQCLTDADCANGGVCACTIAGAYRGIGGYYGNVCAAANCHVDTDCGPSGYCSPSRGYCGSFAGFYCHTQADTCVDETKDCVGCGNACVYTPTVGAFTCGMNICAG